MTVEAKPALKVAVVSFPGSNCELETLRWFQREGHEAGLLWHKETKEPNADVLVLPGGFAYGDRVYENATGKFHIDPGVQALKSPVMDVVREWVAKGRPALGICNGFQVFVQDGLLPGQLLQNESRQFFCDDVDLRVEGKSFFGDQGMVGNVYRLNVAHGYGRYVANEMVYHCLDSKGQIFLRYHGFNPNGSYENIAGVCNEEENIFGMMPHPERADPETSTLFLEAIERYVRG